MPQLTVDAVRVNRDAETLRDFDRPVEDWRSPALPPGVVSQTASVRWSACAQIAARVCVAEARCGQPPEMLHVPDRRTDANLWDARRSQLGDTTTTTVHTAPPRYALENWKFR